MTPMFSPGPLEIGLLIIVALLLFGGSRLAGLGKGAGRAIREFKDEVHTDKPEIEGPEHGVDKRNPGEGPR